jgi:nitrite reductase (NO-forming)
MNRRIASLVAGMAAVSLLAACTASAGKPGWTFAPPAEGSAPPAVASPAPSSDPGTGAAAGSFEIEAFDLGFTPSTVEVDAPGTYEVTFRNTGVAPHDVTFADGTKIVANGGEEATGSVTVPEGGLSFICSVPGHEAGGMTGAVAVKGAAPSPSGGDSHGGPAPSRRRGRPERAALRAVRSQGAGPP